MQVTVDGYSLALFVFGLWICMVFWNLARLQYGIYWKSRCYMNELLKKRGYAKQHLPDGLVFDSIFTPWRNQEFIRLYSGGAKRAYNAEIELQSRMSWDEFVELQERDADQIAKQLNEMKGTISSLNELVDKVKRGK